MEAKEVTVYECGQCGAKWDSKEKAEKCCTKGKCAACGRELPHWYQHECNICFAKKAWNKFNNAFVCASDYDGAVWYNGVTYFETDDVVDDNGEFPEWGVYGTYLETCEMDDSSFQDWWSELDKREYEMEGKAQDEFEDFLQEFNDKWAPRFYYPDFLVSICRDDDPRGHM